MNTDNMSILGLTIDYGPYGWLDDFDPDWTPNTTDAGQRRYRYAHQPNIALWNLFRLAEALHQVTERPELLQASLDRYTDVFRAGHRDAFRAKLGLVSEHEGDDELLDEVFAVMSSAEIDMTIFFRSLPGAAEGAGADDELLAAIAEAFYVPEQIVGDVRESAVAWLRQWRERVLADGRSAEQRRSAMDAVNPRYVLRNYLAQLAIDAADQGDNSVLDELLDTLRHPYTDQPGRDRFASASARLGSDSRRVLHAQLQQLATPRPGSRSYPVGDRQDPVHVAQHGFLDPSGSSRSRYGTSITSRPADADVAAPG